MTARPYRILIVEDSPEDRAAYRRRITQGREQNYQIWETGSGEEGIRLCAEIVPDCILLDYQLPDLDGLEFLDRVRAMAEGDCIAIIMLTGHGNEAVAVQAMKKGVEDYLIKGVNIDLLTSCWRLYSKREDSAGGRGHRREVDRLSADAFSSLTTSTKDAPPGLGKPAKRRVPGHAWTRATKPLAPVRNGLQILRLQAGEIIPSIRLANDGPAIYPHEPHHR